ncbi:MAG: site-2 protease family protein [Ktedonobacteraceae bacterium]|nr:site-2 protease family protein [Ktedonobacteraceae bacterium]
MYQNSDDFPEYGDASRDRDYLHPDYYSQEGVPTPQTPPPARSIEPYPLYPDYSATVSGAEVAGYDLGGEYRGPRSMEGYTRDAGAEQREAAARGSSEGAGKRKGLAKLGGIGIAIGTLLLKLKAILFFLLNLKWLLFIAKFGFAGITALASIVVYSLFFGWPFAIGLVILLFLHEMGHALVMKLKGVPIGGLIFIPMLGAAITMRQMPQNARDEAEVGIAGPFAGAIASSACLAIAKLYPSYSIWAALAYFGFFMNLFNLIPIVPFDGGRVLAAIDRRVWIVGFLGLLAFQIWSWLHGDSSIWLLFFIVIAATQLWSRRSAVDTPQTRKYYTVPVATRITLGLLYFGLAAVLVLGMSTAHGLLRVG